MLPPLKPGRPPLRPLLFLLKGRCRRRLVGGRVFRRRVVVGNPDSAQMRLNLGRHAARQGDGGVVIVDADRTDVAAVDAQFIGDGADNLTWFDAVNVPNGEAVMVFAVTGKIAGPRSPRSSP